MSDRLVEVEPVIRRIVYWRLSMRTPAQDLEDVASDVLLDLFTRLQGSEIEDLPAYAAIAAHHGCDRYLRRRAPQRYRLSLRLRYLFENTPRFALWQVTGGAVCGLAKWRDKVARTDLAPNWWNAISLPQVRDEASAVEALFDHVQAPLRFPDVIEAVAALLNVRDVTVSADEIELADTSTTVEEQLGHRQTLGKLWKEVAQLPSAQRTALLLNLRDAEGGCALTSLPATGVASIRQIAALLEIPAGELAGLWKDLPLSDLQIAARLGLARQQVINLRKTARERLARRMVISGANPHQEK